MSQRIYFPNLNGVRFIAALMVIIHHIELTKYWFGEPNIYRTSFVGGVFGTLGVILFFVLSGFLITYLLLAEFSAERTISIKSFYIRRILRIWPVYYMIVLLGLFILPFFSGFDIPGFSSEIHHNFPAKAVLYLSFLPNIAYAIFPHIPYASQAWSVGVEEQYYLIWPVLVLIALRKGKLMHFLVGVIAVYLIVKAAVIQYVTIVNGGTDEAFDANKFYEFWQYFNIDCMAIGGIAACFLFYKKERILKLFYNKWLQTALYLTIGLITVRGIGVPFITYEVYAVLFAVMILNLAGNTKTLINLEHPLLSYLGKISYGLYMYHNIVLVGMLRLLKDSGLFSFQTVAGNAVYYISTILLTVIIASLSYEFFEKRFLRIKVRFSTVVSGDNVSDEAETARPARPQPAAIPAGNPAKA
jgi:peptidoglycan/LPS O-acetylase OafA/YrhL